MRILYHIGQPVEAGANRVCLVVPGRTGHLDEALVAVVSDSGAHAHERPALEAAAHPFHLCGGRCCTKTSDPAAGDFVGLARRIVIGILYLVHAGCDHSAYQPREGRGTRRIKRRPTVAAGGVIEANPLPPTVFFDEEKPPLLRRDMRAEALQRRQCEFTDIHRVYDWRKLRCEGADVFRALHAPQHGIDVGFLLFQLRLRLDDALLCLAGRLFDVPAGEGRQHQLQDFLVESLAALVVNTGGFEQRLDVADGMRRHLQFFHQAANDVFLESPLQDDVEDADAGMLGGKPLDAADALLYDHWIPGQVVIYQHIGDLKIDTFRSRFGRDDHVAVGRVIPESPDGVLVALSRGTVDDSHF